MKKYIVTYHAPKEALMASAQASPEEMAKGMEPWMQWAAKCGSKLVDMGTPLGMSKKLNPDGSAEDSSREICGYSILEAESMEDAHKLMDGHPHLNWTAECSIEIHEAMPLPGM